MRKISEIEAISKKQPGAPGVAVTAFGRRTLLGYLGSAAGAVITDVHARDAGYAGTFDLGLATG